MSMSWDVLPCRDVDLHGITSFYMFRYCTCISVRCVKVVCAKLFDITT